MELCFMLQTLFQNVLAKSGQGWELLEQKVEFITENIRNMKQWGLLNGL